MALPTSPARSPGRPSGALGTCLPISQPVALQGSSWILSLSSSPPAYSFLRLRVTFMSPQCILSQCLLNKEMSQERQVGSVMLREEKGSPPHKPTSQKTWVHHGLLGFPGGSAVKNPPVRRCSFNPWVRKIHWRRKWQPTPVFLPGRSHGQRSPAGYSPWDHKE